MKKVLINKQANKQGFGIIELILGLALVGIVVGGVYVYNERGNSSSGAVPKTNVTAPDKTTQKLNGGSKNVPVTEEEVQPTIYPTEVPLSSNTSDTEINSVIDDTNEMLGEINSLDKIGQDLQEPKIDFSTGL